MGKGKESGILHKASTKKSIHFGTRNFLVGGSNFAYSNPEFPVAKRSFIKL